VILWTSAALAAPDAFAPCEQQAEYFQTQTRENPRSRPMLWWVEDDPPCPFGLFKVGATPPEGLQIGCQDARGHTYHLQTTFAPDGKVAVESRWDRNREVGPRFEWHPVSYDLLRRTELRDGRLEGEVVEWLPDGGTLVTTYHRGERDGATWRLSERGQVLLIEQWRGGQRHGRHCGWRDEDWFEQTYVSGRPEVAIEPVTEAP
jgi:hypothetical protein